MEPVGQEQQIILCVVSLSCIDLNSKPNMNSGTDMSTD